MYFFIALLQRENIGRLPHPLVFVEQLDLLLAQAIDIEGAARHEVLEVLDRLIGTGELAGTMGARPFGTARDNLAHPGGVQRAWALLRKLIHLGAARTLVEDDTEHLRND